MNVRPLSDHVLLRRLDDTQMSKGGIIIPDTAKEKSQQAQVVAVGKGRCEEKTGSRIPPQVKKGDRVLVRKYAGTEVEIEGKEYWIVREDEILGTIG
jgi:chaperonin GroES